MALSNYEAWKKKRDEEKEKFISSNSTLTQTSSTGEQTSRQLSNYEEWKARREPEEFEQMAQKKEQEKILQQQVAQEPVQSVQPVEEKKDKFFVNLWNKVRGKKPDITSVEIDSTMAISRELFDFSNPRTLQNTTGIAFTKLKVVASQEKERSETVLNDLKYLKEAKELTKEEKVRLFDYFKDSTYLIERKIAEDGKDLVKDWQYEIRGGNVYMNRGSTLQKMDLKKLIPEMEESYKKNLAKLQVNEQLTNEFTGKVAANRGLFEVLSNQLKTGELEPFMPDAVKTKNQRLFNSVVDKFNDGQSLDDLSGSERMAVVDFMNEQLEGSIDRGFWSETMGIAPSVRMSIEFALGSLMGSAVGGSTAAGILGKNAIGGNVAAKVRAENLKRMELQLGESQDGEVYFNVLSGGMSEVEANNRAYLSQGVQDIVEVGLGKVFDTIGAGVGRVVGNTAKKTIVPVLSKTGLGKKVLSISSIVGSVGGKIFNNNSTMKFWLEKIGRNGFLSEVAEEVLQDIVAYATEGEELSLTNPDYWKRIIASVAVLTGLFGTANIAGTIKEVDGRKKFLDAVKENTKSLDNFDLNENGELVYTKDGTIVNTPDAFTEIYNKDVVQETKEDITGGILDGSKTVDKTGAFDELEADIAKAEQEIEQEPQVEGEQRTKDFRKAMEDALIAPSLEGGGDGVVVEVESFGKKGYVPLLEQYKGRDIVQTGDTISVWNPKDKTLFNVALDDSKTTGKRFINQDANNIESARGYIDWITELEEKRKVQQPKAQETPVKLEEEARKYKSAEEFVETQMKPHYINIKDIKSSLDADIFANLKGIPRNQNIDLLSEDTSKTKKIEKAGVGREITEPITINMNIEGGSGYRIIDGNHRYLQALENGEKIILAKFGNGAYTQEGKNLFKTKIKSQLTDIWNKAQPKTQKEKVKEVLEKESKPMSIKEVAEATKILEPNIRRILGVGAKTGEFERVADGVYALKTESGQVAYIQAGNALEELPKLAKDGFKADMVFLDIPYKTPAITGGNRGMKYDFVTPAQFGDVLDSVNKILRKDTSPVIYMYSQAESGLEEMQKYNDMLDKKGLKVIAKGEWQKTYKDGKPVAMFGRVAKPEGILLLSQSGRAVKDILEVDLKFDFVRPKGYQSEKNADMIRDMIELTTNTGDIVLDPFAGSGVVPAEAIKAGRSAVAIEVDKKVVEETIKPRIAKASKEVKTEVKPDTDKVAQLESKAQAEYEKTWDKLTPQQQHKVLMGMVDGQRYIKTTDQDTLVKLGRGVGIMSSKDFTERNIDVLLYKGLEEKMYTDGMVLITDSKVANELNKKFIGQYVKASAKAWGVSEQEANKRIKEGVKDKEFPATKDILDSAKANHKLTPIGFYASETNREAGSIIFRAENGTLVRMSGKYYSAVKSFYPSAEFYITDESNVKPISFMVGKSRKGIVMPMMMPTDTSFTNLVGEGAVKESERAMMDVGKREEQDRLLEKSKAFTREGMMDEMINSIASSIDGEIPIERMPSIDGEIGYSGEGTWKYDNKTGIITVSMIDGRTEKIPMKEARDYVQAYLDKKNNREVEEGDLPFRKEGRKRLNSDKLNNMQLSEMKRLSREIFGDEKVEIMEQVLTPDTLKWMGRYVNEMVQIRAGSVDKGSTFYHEVVHKALDIFLTPQEKALLIKEVRRLKGDDYLREQFGSLTVEDRRRIAKYRGISKAEEILSQYDNMPQKVGAGIEGIVKADPILKGKEGMVQALADSLNIDSAELSGAVLKDTRDSRVVYQLVPINYVGVTYALVQENTLQDENTKYFEIVDLSEVINNENFRALSIKLFEPKTFPYSSAKDAREYQKAFRRDPVVESNFIDYRKQEAKFRGVEEVDLDAMAEEYLAEGILDHINTKTPTTFIGKLKRMVEQFIDRWFGVMDNINDITDFYEGLLSGRLLARQRKLDSQRAKTFDKYLKSIQGAGTKTDAMYRMEVAKEVKKLTTKILKKLEGKASVKKQFISDLTKQQDIKQVEKDIINSVLKTFPDDIDVTTLEEKVLAQLLPLERETLSSGRYQMVTVPSSRDSLGYSDWDYSENIYTSPIEVKAGLQHFGFSMGDVFEAEDQEMLKRDEDIVDRYFGHTRVENSKDIRRVLEVQSDLYQKGQLGEERNILNRYPTSTKQLSLLKGIEQLESQYKNPTAHLRMVREEVRQASLDNVKTLLFPTGKTSAYIEGFLKPDRWKNTKGEIIHNVKGLKYGDIITDSQTNNEWIVLSVNDNVGQREFLGMQNRIFAKPMSSVLTKDSKDLELSSGGILDTIIKNFGFDFYMKGKKLIPKDSEEIVKYIRSKGGKVSAELFIELLRRDASTAYKTVGLATGYTGDPLALNAVIKKEGFDGNDLIDIADIHKDFTWSGEAFYIGEEQNYEKVLKNPEWKATVDFYEKDLGKYLKNNYESKEFVDEDGYTWWEVDIKPEYGGAVEAFRLDELVDYGKVAQSQTLNTKEDPLITEARKYKSAEEFVRYHINNKNSNFPNILYHGSNESFEEFEKKKGKRNYGIFGEEEVETNGFFFTSSKEYAKEYGKNVITAYVRVNNPLIGTKEAQYGELTGQRLKDANYIFAPIVEWDDYVDTNGIKKESAQVGTDVVVYEQDYAGHKLPDNWLSRFIGEDGGIDWRLIDNPEVSMRLLEKGYDGIIVQEDGAEGLSYFVPDGSQIKTESQIKNIWNQAQDTAKYRLEDEEVSVKLPELVTLAENLGANVKLQASFRKAGTGGDFQPQGGTDSRIRILRTLFDPQGEVMINAVTGEEERVPETPEQQMDRIKSVEKVLGHEIGHLFDWFGGADNMTLKRGNILGRIGNFRSFLGGTLMSPEQQSEYSEAKRYAKDLQYERKQVKGVDKGKYKDLGKQLKITNRRIKELEEDTLAKHPEVRKELKTMTQVWNPFEESEVPAEYLKYRYSSKELYAEALSVLFNDPRLLKQTAPTFYQSFVEYLASKKEVKEEFFAIKDTIKESTYIEKRIDKMDEGFEKGRGARMTAVERKEVGKKQREWQNVMSRVKYSIADQHAPYLDKVRKIYKEGGIELSRLQESEMLMDEMEFIGDKQGIYAKDIQANFFDPISEAGISVDDLGKIMVLERDLGDRKDLANPQGLVYDYAKETYDELKAKFSPAEWVVLQDRINWFREYNFNLVQEGYKAGVYSKQFFEEIATVNKNTYTPFAVIEYINDNYVTAGIIQAKGTLKQVENPINTQMLKSLELIRLTATNSAKTDIIKTLQEFAPEEIVQAQAVRGEDGYVKMFKRDPELADKGYEQLELLIDGKRTAFYVDGYIKESFDKLLDMSTSQAVKMFFAPVRAFNRIFKPAVTTFKPSFQFYSNPIKDVKDSLNNLSALSAYFDQDNRGVALRTGRVYKAFMKEWMASLKQSWDYAGNKMDKVTEQMLRVHAISGNIKYEDIDLGTDEISFDAVKNRVVHKGKVNWADSAIEWMGSKAILKQTIYPLLKVYQRLGQTLEVNSKVAGFQYFTKEIGLDERTAGYYTRKYVGTPNFMQKGKFTNITNEIQPFSNVAMQGFSRSIELAGSPKTASGYWFSMFFSTIVPKLVMLAGATLLKVPIPDPDDEDKTIWVNPFDYMSEYDKSNYITIPIGYDITTKKFLYLRIPMSETEQVVGNAVWKMGRVLQGEGIKVEQLAVSVIGMIPFAGLVFGDGNPFTEIVGGWADYVQGRNPYDDFRGRPAIATSKWDQAGAVRFSEMLKWTSNTIGLSNFTTYDKDLDTTFEHVLQAPILERMFRLSDYGLTEREEWEKDMGKRSKNKTLDGYLEKYYSQPSDKNLLKYQEEYVIAVKGERPKDGWTGTEKAEETRLKSEFKREILANSGNGLYISIAKTGLSNDEKVKIINTKTKNMSDEQKADYLSQVVKYEVVKGEMFAQYAKDKGLSDETVYKVVKQSIPVLSAESNNDLLWELRKLDMISDRSLSQLRSDGLLTSAGYAKYKEVTARWYEDRYTRNSRTETTDTRNSLF